MLVFSATGSRGDVRVAGVTSSFVASGRYNPSEKNAGYINVPAGCSSNNSRVAEVHVYGSYARGHMILLLFSCLKDDVVLILCPRSRERIGVWSGVCVGHYVGAVRTMFQSPERRPSSIGWSNMQYDPSVHLPSAYRMFIVLVPC